MTSPDTQGAPKRPLDDREWHALLDAMVKEAEDIERRARALRVLAERLVP